jgi:CheY-like chemotaxis protein
MKNNETEGPKPFTINCFTCKKPFDMMAAPWCNCITNDPTLVCSHCSNCFCTAPKEYRDSFWSMAPQDLWDQRLERSGGEDLPGNPEPENAQRPLVLVVDDDVEIQKIARRAVAGLGYGIIVARSGTEGLELTERYLPDLVLTDALMPGLDGREMCRLIKQNRKLAGVRVVIMTALYKQARHKYEAHRDFLADDFLNKPLKLALLRDKLQKLLNPNRASKEAEE